MLTRELQFISIFTIFLLIPAIAYGFQTDWEKAGDQTVSLLKKYVSINTSNPPGDVSLAAEFLRDEFAAAGINAELIWTDKSTGRVNVLARLKGNGTKRPLLLLHHMDVVPVNKNAWTVDPFGGVEKEGYIWGRGSLDMKNNGIVQLKTMELLKQNGILLERDVIFLAVVDEETSGELGAQWIAANKWDEINAEYILDEGGFGTEGFFTHDNRLIFSVGVAEKKIMWLRLTVTGTPGHGSMPPKDNANFIMSQALARVAEYETPVRKTEVVQEMEQRIGELEDTPYNNALKRNTISLTVTKGYVGDPPKSNVIPGISQAVLDCRLLPDQNPDEFLEELKSVINDSRVKVEFIEKPVDAIISPFDTELFRVIEQETQKVYPGSVTLPHLIIYGTDSRFFRPKGATCYGFFPGPTTMEEYKRIHGNDERIRTESLRKAVRAYYNVVREFCQVK